MKKIFVILLALTTSAFAQSERTQLVDSIKNRAAGIQKIISASSDTPIEQLREIERLIVEAAEILRTGSSTDERVRQECLDFAFTTYYRTMSRTQALDRANQKCSNIEDMEILKYAYEIFYRTNSSSNALDLAIDASSGSTKGKFKMLEFSFDKHYRTESSQNALKKALENIKVSSASRGLSCYQQYFDQFYRYDSASRAMDKTAEFCR